MLMMNNKLIDFKTIGSGDGSLSFFEGQRDIPFEIKRIYFIHGTPEGVVRGNHAHKQLKQILFCVHGKVEVYLDDGNQNTTVLLDSPSKGLIVVQGIWRTMKFDGVDSVLCVAASEYYDESDYVRNYDEFIKLVKAGYWK